MSRQPDLVNDSKLRTEFRDSTTIHWYPEIDEDGRRFSRLEYWKWEGEGHVGRGGFGQVRLQRCVTEGAKLNSLRAVKIIDKPVHLSESLDVGRELETIAKFSNDRVSQIILKNTIPI